MHIKLPKRSVHTANNNDDDYDDAEEWHVNAICFTMMPFRFTNPHSLKSGTRDCDIS